MAKLRGKAKEEFLKRMARGRSKAKKQNPKKRAAKKNPNARKTKKTIGKGFGKQLAAEHIRAKKKAAKARKATRKATRAPKKKNPKRVTRRRNPDDIAAAERMYEQFHQTPANRIIEYEQVINMPENFAECGDLHELRFDLDDDNYDFPIKKFDGAKVICTTDGANIYFVGGDQALDFETLGIASDKDQVELGSCTYICYDTIKGFHDFKETHYWHRFGEENDIRPKLCYDRLSRRLYLMGGDYRVTREGIVN